MYRIIGADQKEYGSVTADQLRQWIADGRVNGQTPAQIEGAPDWKTLSSFPEFAEALGLGTSAGAPPPLVAQADGRPTALRRVKAPAVALMIIASLDILLTLWGLFGKLLMHANPQRYDSQMHELENLLQQLNNPQSRELMERLIHVMYGPWGIVGDLFTLVMAGLILMGALKMKSLRSYEFSITAAILCMVPCVTPCCGWIFGLPFGIWALVVLRSPEVKSSFH